MKRRVLWKGLERDLASEISAASNGWIPDLDFSVLPQRVGCASVSLPSRVQKNQIFGHSLCRVFLFYAGENGRLTKKPRRAAVV